MKIIFLIACASVMVWGNPKCRTIRYERDHEGAYVEVINMTCREYPSTQCVLVQFENEDVFTTCSQTKFGYCSKMGLTNTKK